MIERQIGQLSREEKQVVEVASVVGYEFSAAPIAAVLDLPVTTVETYCDDLVRRGRMLSAPAVPVVSEDPTVGYYSFRHALYQAVLYDSLIPGRRLRLHSRIGTSEEQRYGERAREYAAILAHHFEEGRDYPRAVEYLRFAAQQSLQRFAAREAGVYYQRALTLLAYTPESTERSENEMRLQLALGRTLMGTKGYADPAVEIAFSRVRELNLRMGVSTLQFAALAGLWGFYFMRANLKIAEDLAQQLVHQAMQDDEVMTRTEAYFAVGSTALYSGEVQKARQAFETGAELSSAQPEQALAARVVQHPGAASASYLAWTLWFLGFPEQSLQCNQGALQRAQHLAHPFTQAVAIDLAVTLHQCRHELESLQAHALELEQIAIKHEYPLWLMTSRIGQGWVLVQQGQHEKGLTQMQYGIAAMRQAGAAVSLTYYLTILAEAQSLAGQWQEGLTSLAEAMQLVQQHGEHFYEAEIYRVKGELLLAQQSKRKNSKGR
ncbi:MAG: hypothetical protein FJ147_20615 [Deltaproteobacteria bacterium]|nr:hypothetical protein [Deltaproteobacteria bacterium]